MGGEGSDDGVDRFLVEEVVADVEVAKMGGLSIEQSRIYSSVRKGSKK